MNVNIEKIEGSWDLGYVLDKQVISSTYLGEDENGRKQFDTLRTDIGEAVYQLKYQSDTSKVVPLANEIVKLVKKQFKNIDVIIPVPPSKRRSMQPVYEVAKAVAHQLGKPYRENILIKNASTPQMKDLKTQQEKRAALQGSFSVSKSLTDTNVDILIIDDIYSTGSSLSVACEVLRKYKAIRKIYVAVLSRTK